MWSLCLSVCDCVSHIWSAACELVQIEFSVQSRKSSKHSHTVRSVWDSRPMCSVWLCEGLGGFFNPQLSSCFCHLCVAESHCSSQLSRSAQWTSSFEIFHFTLCCQAPCRWVTQVRPNCSRGWGGLYLRYPQDIHSVGRELFSMCKCVFWFFLSL